MMKLLKTPFQKGAALLAVIVDVFSLIQIFKQTRFRMPELFNSAWFWLFVIVTITTAITFVYFKYKDFKQRIADYKESIEAYKRRVSDEFNKRMAEESNLHKRCNELGWRIDKLTTELDKLKKEQHVQETI
jgi:hypothetical protein